jgi:glucose-1-phosphate thymidylyltransferase
MNDRIGIIMAGGKGTRLYPLTKVMNKHLLPVHDKPMIYYPLSTLIRLGHKTIYLISTKESIPLFKKLLGSGKQYGIKLHYKVQDKPKGIAHCFFLLKKQIENKKTTLILGDNLFISNFENLTSNIHKQGCTLVCTTVREPQHYGVVTLKQNQIINIEEKPKNQHLIL